MDESLLTEGDKQMMKNLEDFVKKGIISSTEAEKKKISIFEKRSASNSTRGRQGRDRQATVFVLNLDKVVDSVKRNDQNIKELVLEEKRVTNSVVALLCEALKSNSNLKKVDLKKNLFDDDCVPSIASMMLENKTLEL